MAVNKAFRVGSSASYGDLDASFDYTIQNTDTLVFSSVYDSIEGLPLNTWASFILITDGTISTINKRVKATQYVDYESVNLVSGLTGVASPTTSLNIMNVQQEDCVIRFDWGDTTTNTALSNGKFYVFDKVNLRDSPSSLSMVAFERTATGIYTNRISGDTGGLAWNDDGGIGGRLSALSLQDQPSAATHSFYLGLSCVATAYGPAPVGLVIEFDVN